MVSKNMIKGARIIVSLFANSFPRLYAFFIAKNQTVFTNFHIRRAQKMGHAWLGYLKNM